MPVSIGHWEPQNASAIDDSQNLRADLVITVIILGNYRFLDSERKPTGWLAVQLAAPLLRSSHLLLRDGLGQVAGLNVGKLTPDFTFYLINKFTTAPSD